MSRPQPSAKSRASAEAAAWLARLQGDTRTPAGEAAFKKWLAADPTHQRAFEKATDIWADLPGAAKLLEERAPHPLRPPTSLWQPSIARLAIAASVVVAVGLGMMLLLMRPAAYSTAIGEQKVATLPDGSRIALNTDSSVEVRYDADERLIELDRGEAMFEVTHNSMRPFIVRAGNKQVRAVGTSFVVRLEGNDVVVTLLEGKVAVTDVGRGAVEAKPTYLNPGDRLRAPERGAAQIDSQVADAATAWRRGQAMFSDTPLADAIDELNRYGGPRLVIDDPRLAGLKVSGVFGTNDTREFARAIAALHGVRVEQRGDIVHIVR